MAVDSLRALSALYPVSGDRAAETRTASASSTPRAVYKPRGGSLKRKRYILSLVNPAEVEDGEEETMVSGWGEAEDMKEDLLKEWGEALEKWDIKQRERTRPKLISKLCRKASVESFDTSIYIGCI